MRGSAVASRAAVVMGLMVVVAVGVEGGLLGGAPPWGRVASSAGVSVAMVVAGSDCFNSSLLANVVAVCGGEFARDFLVLARCG